jgi:hypothetical protein
MGLRLKCYLLLLLLYSIKIERWVIDCAALKGVGVVGYLLRSFELSLIFDVMFSLMF